MIYDERERGHSETAREGPEKDGEREAKVEQRERGNSGTVSERPQ